MRDIVTYAVTESVVDDDRWLSLLRMKLKEADCVEFNTLFKPRDLAPELELLRSDLVKEGKRKDKIYPSGIFRRYKLTDRLKEFVLSKPYNSWRNYQYEDLSLIKDEVEILATITHENYIYIIATEEEIVDLNNQGYEFGDLFQLE